MYFEIIGDSSADLSPDIRELYNIKYIMGHLHLPSGEEIPARMDWEKISSEEFYEAVKKNPDGFTTAPATPMEVAEAFRSAVADGKGILYTCMSSKMSGTYDFACKAKEIVLDEFPQAQICLIDSRKFATGAGLILVLASVMRSEGKSLEETAAYLESVKNGIHQAGWHDDLQYSAKKGRISNSKAFMGTLIGIKPMGDFSPDGMTTVLTKVKGEKTAYQVLLRYIERTAIRPEEQIILVGNSNRRKQAEKFAEMIREKFHPKAVYVSDFFLTCGPNAGPGIMAAYYLGTPISENLTEETKIYEELTK